MAMSARLLQPLENPSGVTPIMEVPTKTVRAARKNPNAERPINTIAIVRIVSPSFTAFG